MSQKYMFDYSPLFVYRELGKWSHLSLCIRGVCFCYFINICLSPDVNTWPNVEGKVILKKNF